MKLRTLLFAVAAGLTPFHAHAKEMLEVSGTVKASDVSKAHLIMVVGSDGGGYVRRLADHPPGRYDLGPVECGEKDWYFEVWTPQSGPPVGMFVSANFSIEGPVSAMNPSRGLRRRVTSSVLRNWHHKGDDFGLWIRIKCE